MHQLYLAHEAVTPLRIPGCMATMVAASANRKAKDKGK
jgi:hypothetical protein